MNRWLPLKDFKPNENSKDFEIMKLSKHDNDTCIMKSIPSFPSSLYSTKTTFTIEV